MRHWLKLWSCSSPPSKRSAEIHSNIRGIKRRITSCRYPSGLCVRIDAIREWASARVGLYNILKSTRKHMQLAQLAITSRSLTDSQTPDTPQWVVLCSTAARRTQQPHCTLSQYLSVRKRHTTKKPREEKADCLEKPRTKLLLAE